MNHLQMLLSISTANSINTQQFTIQDNIIEFEEQKVESIEVTLSPKADLVREHLEFWMNDNYELDVNVQIQLSLDKGYMNAKAVDILSALSKKIDLLGISKKGVESNTLRRLISLIHEFHTPNVKIKKVLRLAS